MTLTEENIQVVQDALPLPIDNIWDILVDAAQDHDLPLLQNIILDLKKAQDVLRLVKE